MTARRSNPRAASRQRQKGVAAVFAAVALLTLLSAVALAIDVGRLYTTQRDLQRLADLAAIDAARVQSQCLGGAGADDINAEALASLNRNRAPTFVTRQVRLGRRVDGDDGQVRFVPTAAGSGGDAVQVTLSRASPARILPLFAGDEARTLSVRAAAQSRAAANQTIGAPLGRSANPEFLNPFFGGLLGGGLSLTADEFRTAAEVSLSVSELMDARVAAGADGVDLSQTEPVLGLLSQIVATLAAAGDTVAAAAVQAFADAVAAGRPGAAVVPAEVLGVPVGGNYDGLTANVGSVLNAIAGAVANGSEISLPDLGLPFPLGDTSVTGRITRPGRPGSFAPGSETLSVSNSDAAFSAAGLIALQLSLVDPISGQPFKLPVLLEMRSAQARVTGISCARFGQALHQADVEAQGALMAFGIGNSGRFTSTVDAGTTGVLDDLVPADLLTVDLLGQAVTLTVQAGPFTVGDDRPDDYCFQGPPWGEAVQCNGTPALAGGASSDEAAQRLADDLSNVRLGVRLPPTLPAVLAGPVNALVDERLAALSGVIQPALNLLAAQLVPLLDSVNLVAGASPVRVQSMAVSQPEVFAR